MPLVLGGSSAAAAAYSIDNSCRFNQPDDASMTLTMGTPTNADKFSLSMWVKRGSRLNEEGTLYTGGTSSSNGDILHFYGTGELQWQMYHGSYVGRLKTKKKEIIKSQASGLLTPTDWHVVKAAEVESYSIPAAMTTYRAAVRTASNDMEVLIDACSTVDELAALYVHTEQPDGTSTKPLGEWPKEV